MHGASGAQTLSKQCLAQEQARIILTLSDTAFYSFHELMADTRVDPLPQRQRQGGWAAAHQLHRIPIRLMDPIEGPRDLGVGINIVDDLSAGRIPVHARRTVTHIAPYSSLGLVRALLEQAALPSEDLTDHHLRHFFVAGDESAPLGIVGLELNPPDGLLRSLAVSRFARRRGLGAKLLKTAEQHARDQNVRSLYLLTTTAESFFEARGYVRAERSSAPDFIRKSAEFSSLCPASATFMVKHF